MNNIWARKHQKYRTQDWAQKPSVFAEQARGYFPDQCSILELGAGIGQDSVYFAENGFDVTSTDLEISALVERASQSSVDINIIALDLGDALPFGDNSFDVVYAHLSLHYFDRLTTERIFGDIHRILKPGGILAFLTNSTSDPEYGTGREIEEHYHDVDGMAKRFFDINDAREFARDFEPLLCDDRGETHKDNAVGVRNLIRFVGQKR